MIVVVDYGMGNLYSVKRKLDLLSVDGIISSSPADLKKADKIILPGVGHFNQAMNNLKTLGLDDALNETVLQKQKPILGICLGMQLMASHSEEGNATGFGWFNADVKKMLVRNSIQFKIPHMGWNEVEQKKPSRLLQHINDASEFYFVHSYYWQSHQPQDVLCNTVYENTFTSAVEKQNIFGVQFHPEKSHDAGMQLLKNFISI